MEGRKVQRLKRFMESHGAKFPKDVDYGKRRNRQSKPTFFFLTHFISLSLDIVRRSRQAYADAEEALRLGNIEDAEEAANEMCTLLAADKINDPLVEVDNAGKLVSVQIKVILSMFRKLSPLINRFFPGVLREEFQGVPGHGEVLGSGRVAV